MSNRCPVTGNRLYLNARAKSLVTDHWSLVTSP